MAEKSEIVRETLFSYYPRHTSRGRVPCLLRWHADDSVSAVVPPQTANAKAETLFTCPAADIDRVVVIQTIRIFHIGAARYRIGLDARAARKLGVRESFAPGSAMSAARAAAKVLDPWWTDHLRAAGVDHRPDWRAPAIVLLGIVIVIVILALVL